MKIKLDDRFTLNSDRYSVWISEKKVTKKGTNIGKEYDDAYDGYHKNIEDCFESFFDAQIGMAEVTSITKLIETIKTERKRIKGWCEALEKHIQEVRTSREDRLV